MPAQRKPGVRPTRRRWLLPSSAGALCATAASVLALGAPDPVRQAQLTTLVRQDCGSCHGMTLGGGLGKPLTPAALADLQVDSIAFIILEGVPGQPMPPWKGLLTAQEAHWIASKLKEGFPE